jgi:hypothetical protein
MALWLGAASLHYKHLELTVAKDHIDARFCENRRKAEILCTLKVSGTRKVWMARI